MDETGHRTATPRPVRRRRLLEASPRFADSFGLLLLLLIAGYFAVAVTGDGEAARHPLDDMALAGRKIIIADFQNALGKQFHGFGWGGHHRGMSSGFDRCPIHRRGGGISQAIAVARDVKHRNRQASAAEAPQLVRNWNRTCAGLRT